MSRSRQNSRPPPMPPSRATAKSIFWRTMRASAPAAAMEQWTDANWNWVLGVNLMLVIWGIEIFGPLIEARRRRSGCFHGTSRRRTDFGNKSAVRREQIWRGGAVRGTASGARAAQHRGIRSVSRHYPHADHQLPAQRATAIRRRRRQPAADRRTARRGHQKRFTRGSTTASSRSMSANWFARPLKTTGPTFSPTPSTSPSLPRASPRSSRVSTASADGRRGASHRGCSRLG